MIKEEDFTLDNKLISTRYIGLFAGLKTGVSWECHYSTYDLTDNDHIIFSSTQDMFQLGRLDVIINRICSLYGIYQVETAIEKFDAKLAQRAEKLGIEELDICYTLTFIYKVAEIKKNIEELSKENGVINSFLLGENIYRITKGDSPRTCTN